MGPHILPHARLRVTDTSHISGALGAHLDHLELGPTQGMSWGMHR